MQQQGHVNEELHTIVASKVHEHVIWLHVGKGGDGIRHIPVQIYHVNT